MTVAKIIEQLKSASKSILKKSFYGFGFCAVSLFIFPLGLLVFTINGLIYFISVTLFKVKIIFYPEQQYAFDQLVVIAKEELEKVKSMTNEELFAKAEDSDENLILNNNFEFRNRSAYINITMYDFGKTCFVILHYGVSYFKSVFSDSERGVIGFKILEDGSRVELTDEEAKKFA